MSKLPNRPSWVFRAPTGRHWSNQRFTFCRYRSLPRNCDAGVSLKLRLTIRSGDKSLVLPQATTLSHRARGTRQDRSSIIGYKRSDLEANEPACPSRRTQHPRRQRRLPRPKPICGRTHRPTFCSCTSRWALPGGGCRHRAIDVVVELPRRSCPSLTRRR